MDKNEKMALWKVNRLVLLGEVKSLGKMKRIIERIQEGNTVYESGIEYFDSLISEQGQNTSKVIEQLEAIDNDKAVELKDILVEYIRLEKVDSDEELLALIRETKLNKELDIESFEEKMRKLMLEASKSF